MNGRYAPSPTSGLHLGNLRTALAAWLFARSSGRGFLLRIEDLDTTRVNAAPQVAAQQLADLAELGITFDAPPLWQSARLDHYTAMAKSLSAHIYECFCTRKEIAAAASAPHADYHPYPGTCRNLAAAERAERRKLRPPAWRIRVSPAATVQHIHDYWAGDCVGVVDDFVIRRNDGAWAYNFVAMVDDIAQDVDQVVRGADLLSSAPRQAWLTTLLGGQIPQYAHIPLVVSSAGQRLSKRDAAITLDDLKARHMNAADVRSLLAHSLGLADVGEPVSMKDLLTRFDPAKIPTTNWAVPF